MNVSLADLKKNYKSLEVTFDLWKGESDAQEYIPGLIEDLQKKGLAYESQGALVVDVAKKGDSKELPPCIIRKSDGQPCMPLQIWERFLTGRKPMLRQNIFILRTKGRNFILFRCSG